MTVTYNPVRAGHETAARLAMHCDPVVAAMSRPNQAADLLAIVAAALRLRGHAHVTLLPRESNRIEVGGYSVAWTTGRGDIRIAAALVFNGHTHVVPEGCDASTVTLGSRLATVERIVAAIEKRMAARAKSLPVPVDAIVRDP